MKILMDTTYFHMLSTLSFKISKALFAQSCLANVQTIHGLYTENVFLPDCTVPPILLA